LKIRQPFLFPVDCKAYTNTDEKAKRQNQKQLMDEVQALLSFVALKRLQKSSPPFFFLFCHFVASHRAYARGKNKPCRQEPTPITPKPL